MFYQGKRESVKAIKQVIQEFSSFTGLHLNLGKSPLTFLAAVTNHDELLEIMGVSEETLPLKYLGTLVIGRDL